MTLDETIDRIIARFNDAVSDAARHWRTPRTFDFHTADNAEIPFVGVYEVDEHGEAGRDICIFPIVPGGIDAAEGKAIDYIERLTSTLERLRDHPPEVVLPNTLSYFLADLHKEPQV